MHRHQNVVSKACRKCLQPRCSSTASKLKPKLWEDNLAPTIPPPRPQGFQRSAAPRLPPSTTRDWAPPPPIPRKDPPPSLRQSLMGRVVPPSSGTVLPQKPASPPENQEPATSENNFKRELAPHQMLSSTEREPVKTELKSVKLDIFEDIPHLGERHAREARPVEEQHSTDDYATVSQDSDFTPNDFVDDEYEPERRRKYREPEERKKGSLLRDWEDPATERYTPRRPQQQQQQQARQPYKKKRTFKSLKEKRVIPDVYIPSIVTVGALAQLLGVRLIHLQRAMLRAGMQDEMAYDHVLTADYAVLLAEEFNQNPIVDDELAFDLYARPPHPDPLSLPTRPPVVTIMGHVDHGKTTLLDTLRSTAVAKGEAGGITQHIGAFSVPVPGTTDGSITFLDTPGHAAFSAMRARGASVTDIIVLVVAADDGIMPQTREVIDLIKKEQEKVSVVVAINKVDKSGADIPAVERALMGEGVELETMGGDIPAVHVSGLTGHNLPTLVETLSVIAEMQDIRAEKDGPVNGYVLESKVTKGLGSVATVLVLRGSLQPGDLIIAGSCQAKVRNMTDSNGQSVTVAPPGMAVTVSGWKELPAAGDEVLQGSESDIKKALANRERKAEIEASLKDVDAINKARREERERREAEDEEAQKDVVARQLLQNTGPKSAKIMIKADVSGSAEAVAGAIHGIGNEIARSQVISSAVGDVTESDIKTARAAGASIAAFSVKTSKAMELLAKANNVTILSSTIIYRLVESVTELVIDLLPKIIETRVTGEATVLQIFDIATKNGVRKVAGARVTNGMMERGKEAKVLRDGQMIHQGSMDTMRILKKDVKEIRKGTECGLSLVNYSDLQPGDIIQMVEYTELPGVI